MSIRLNRKKLLCVTFFLCCVLPACFSWFSVEDTHWSGLSLMELPLLISTSLFALALLFERVTYVLPLGIFSHLLLSAFMVYNFIRFPIHAGLSATRDLSFCVDAAEPMLWVSFVLHLFHLALFTTTEIAMQRLYTSAHSKRS